MNRFFSWIVLLLAAAMGLLVMAVFSALAVLSLLVSLLRGWLGGRPSPVAELWRRQRAQARQRRQRVWPGGAGLPTRGVPVRAEAPVSDVRWRDVGAAPRD